MIVLADRSLLWTSALVAAGLSALYVLLGPPGPDLAAQVYRAGLAATHGLAIWNGQWYGGHYLLGYSVLTPIAAAAIGTQLLGIVATAVSAAAFADLLQRHSDTGARAGAIWLSVALVTNVIVGRTAFSLGLAFGLLALSALRRDRPRLAAGAAVLCSLASPVAGAFLALAGCAVWITSRGRAALYTALAALVPVALLAWLFPQAGSQPFTALSFGEAVAFSLGALALTPRRERVVRVGLVLYAGSCVASFAVATPLGSNVLRLGALFGGPTLAYVLPARRRALIALAGVLLALWQWLPAVAAMTGAADDRSTDPAYFQPLLSYVGAHAVPIGRIEIPPTRNHWEAAYVAPHIALARGWERQLDVGYDRLFYSNHLASGAYYAWLRQNAVRYVAVPDAPLDPSAEAEVALIDRNPPYLRLVDRSAHWRIFAVARPLPLASTGSVTEFGDSSFSLVAHRAGAITVRVHFTPLWHIETGEGCLEATTEGWTRVLVPRPERLRVAIRLAPEALLDSSDRTCNLRRARRALRVAARGSRRG
ncbi:MAG: hypothetical protein JWN32_85 [Solirubrobacterales bacterium]|nr:hypothetical protein [Solirubrobacterales bacterium]